MTGPNLPQYGLIVDGQITQFTEQEWTECFNVLRNHGMQYLESGSRDAQSVATKLNEVAGIPAGERSKQ